MSPDGAKSYTVTGTLNWSPTIGNNGQTLFCDVAHPITLNTPQTVSLPLTVIGNYYYLLLAFLLRCFSYKFIFKYNKYITMSEVLCNRTTKFK